MAARRDFTRESLAAGVRAGDKRALARAITLVENSDPLAYELVRDVYPDMDLENIKIMIDTPGQIFAEYEFTAQSSKTGRTIHELFFGRLVAENGEIKLLRESVNLVEIALGVFPNGLADYKAPSEHKP